MRIHTTTPVKFLLASLLVSLGAVYGDATGMNIEFLSGHWENDSIKTKIELRNVNGELVLLADSFFKYRFFKTGAFPLTGTTWPPHGCSIGKSNKDQIEITFINFGGKPVKFRYRKTAAPGI